MIWIPGTPVPHPRPRVVQRGGKSFVYYPERYSEWFDKARIHLRRAIPTRGMKGPFRLEVEFHADGIAVELYPVDTARPKGVRGDLDNLIKSVGDALQRSGIIDNDRDIHEIVARFSE